MEIKEYCSKKGLDFEKLEKEFEVSSIDEGFIPKRISEKIFDKVEKYRKIMEEYLHADGSNIAVLMEIKVMDEKDKDLMNEIYKKLILIERGYLICELESEEEKFIDYINKSFENWNKVRDSLKALIAKAKESWKHKADNEEKLGYLG